MRALKGLLLGVAALLGLLLAALLALPLLVDPDRHRDRIVAAVEQATGRSFSLGGEISWRLFPTLALSAGPVALGNDPAFESPAFLAAERVSAGLALLPLLQRRMEVGEVTLRGVRLSLAVGADGRDNWSSLLAAGAHSPGSAFALSVESLRLHDAAVSFENRRSGLVAAVTGLDLSLAPLRAGAVSRLALSGRGAAAGWHGELALTAALEDLLDGPPPRAVVETLTAVLAAPVPLRLGLGGPLELDLAAGTLELPALDLESGRARARLGVSVRGLPASLEGEGRLQVPAFAPGPWLAEIGRHDLPRSDPDTLGRFEATAEFRFGDGGVAVEPLAARLDGSRLVGRLSLDPALRFQLRLDAIDLDRYLPADGARAAPVRPEEPLLLDLPVPAVDGRLEIGRLRFAGLDAADVSVAVQGDAEALRLVPLAGEPEGPPP